MRFELRPHQRKAVEQLDNGKILYGGVGSGKTIASLAYFYEKVCGGDLSHIPSMTRKRDLYVITTAKKRDDGDWGKDAVKLGLGLHEDSMDQIHFVVDSWNNLPKYKEVKDAFFIFDEQRLVGSGAWTKAFVKIAKSNGWILLSATPGDTWLDYIPVFVANGFYKNRTEFKREHVVYNTYSKFPKVDRYINTGTLIKHRRHILVPMPFERHTVRIAHAIKAKYDTELYEKVAKDRWHVYENRPLRDIAETFSVLRKVVNSDTSRLEALSDVLSSKKKVIVFYNFDYELLNLRRFGSHILQTSILSPEGRSTCDGATHGTTETCPLGSSCTTLSLTNFTVAEWNGHKHQPVPETDSWLYFVQYQAGAEGWNCVSTDAIFFYSLTYSYKLWEQAHGRIDRLNTPFFNLHYYKVMSDAPIDLGVWRALKGKQSFNEASSKALASKL